MAEQSFPFENIDTTETQFSQWASNFQDTGVQGSPTGTELKVTAEGSTLSVLVDVGQAFIRGHYYINTEAIELSIASAGLDTRIDYVVVELDPEANTIAAKVIQGTAVASDPVAPTLTQSATEVYQLPIAQITIPNSTLAITNEMITDVRTFMSNRVGIWTTATRPVNPIENQTLGFNTTIGAHEMWNGTAWVGFADPISTQGDLIVGGVSGAPERLPIGADDQVLTVVAGEVAWADAAARGVPTVYQASGASVPNVISNLILAAGNSYVLYNYKGGTLTIKFFNSSGVQTGGTIGLTEGGGELVAVPADSTFATAQFSGASPYFGVADFYEVEATMPTLEAYVITFTQSVTLTKSFSAYVFGGGGGGGGIATAADDAGGAGGGSGYFSTGTLTAGTYTATIGAGGVGVVGANGTNGSASSIGAITANGGNGGGGALTLGVGGNGGNGGSGGSPGASNASGGANALKGGVNGSNSDIYGTGGSVGIGSGVMIPGSTTLYPLIGPAADTNVNANTYASGFYSGGWAYGVGPSTITGTNANSFAGGGTGARGDATGAVAVAGGNGEQGVIYLIEVPA